MSGAIDVEVARRHVQIQIALIEIGKQLQYQTWVAQGDRGIKYGTKRLDQLDGVVSRLTDLPQVSSYPSAIEAAKHIDVVWFKNGRLMPAVLEIEHSTGVTSGLTRMKGFFDNIPPFPTRYVVVAPDEDRSKVVEQANRPQFKALAAKFFPYSAVEELYSLCQRRQIRGVTEEFLDCYMETVVN